MSTATQIHTETQIIRIVPSGKARRIPALDFTKGALVLIMVLYHWLNYFYGIRGDIYRYLRFLTPSFIFITGFLISNVYLSKYGVADPHLPKRLTQRGLKIVGVFVGLNVVRSLLLPGNGFAKMFADLSVKTFLTVYVVGSNLGAGADKTIAFSVLLPIGYLLILSAGLLFACRYYRYVFHIVWLLFLLATVVAIANNVQSTNLELLTIGFLGVILGYIPIDKINTAVRRPFLLAVAYAGYLTAITIWNVIYPLQVVGVCLSLAVLYLLGDSSREPGRIRGSILLLGKYSLFGYIAQIAVLQVLHRGLQHFRLGAAALVLSFFAAVALTILAVEVTDRARASLAPVDRLYKAVFA